jgi:hypothetical protein
MSCICTKKVPLIILELFFLITIAFDYQAYNALNADVGLIKSTDLLILESVERIEGSQSSVESFLRAGEAWCLYHRAILMN